MEKLPHNQQVAAQLLASGQMDKQEIAKVVGVNRGTLWNWETKDKDFMAEVDRLKQEVKSLGSTLINGKLIEAVKEYWELIQTTNNDRVKAEGLKYFIDRSLGKPTTMIDIEAGLKEQDSIDEDVLESEFDAWDSEEE